MVKQNIQPSTTSTFQSKVKNFTQTFLKRIWGETICQCQYLQFPIFKLTTTVGKINVKALLTFMLEVAVDIDNSQIRGPRFAGALQIRVECLHRFQYMQKSYTVLRIGPLARSARPVSDDFVIASESGAAAVASVRRAAHQHINRMLVTRAES